MGEIETAERWLDEVAPFVEETLGRAGALRKLAEDVNELLAESEASCAHPRLRAAYAEAEAHHARLINDILDLLDETDSVRGEFADAHYRDGIEEVVKGLGRLKNANPQTLEALGPLVPALEPVRNRVITAPEQISLAVVAVMVSPSCLVRWHFEALSEYLNRPSAWNRLIEGVGKLLKAALVDAGGAVMPFLGTAEVMCQLSVRQISRDRERIRGANDDISRLYFFGDHLAELSWGAETAQDNAKRAKEFVVQERRSFDDDCKWLLETVGNL